MNPPIITFLPAHRVCNKPGLNLTKLTLSEIVDVRGYIGGGVVIFNK